MQSWAVRCAVMVIGLVSQASYAGVEGSASLELGYRVDNVDWNIAGDTTGQNPNILSELQWKNLKTPQAKLNLQLRLFYDVYLESYVSYGEIKKGENQDSDYVLDNRQGEFSRSNNNGGDGEVADASVGVSYKIETDQYGARLKYVKPAIGYSIHRIDLIMTEGFQTIPATGSFPGLNSTYDMEWDGPWIAITFGEEDTRHDFIVELDIIYHIVDYQAQADWNLRVGPPNGYMHPVSYEHFADGRGVTLSLRGKKEISKHLFWAFSLDYRRWEADNGLDQTYMWDGQVLQTKFNEVNWESKAINIGLGLSL